MANLIADVKIEITNAINRIFEMFTLSNSGYNIKEFNELQRELKRGGENE